MRRCRSTWDGLFRLPPATASREDFSPKKVNPPMVQVEIALSGTSTPRGDGNFGFRLATLIDDGTIPPNDAEAIPPGQAEFIPPLFPPPLCSTPQSEDSPSSGGSVCTILPRPSPMFSAVFGLFSQDLSVDLGSSRTRVYLRGSGLLCDEPSVVTVHRRKDGRRRVLCVGDDALPAVGRTPEDIEAIRPVRDGTIEDFEVAEALLTQLLRRSNGTKTILKPRMAVALPQGTTDMALRALRDSCESAGARDVHLVPRPIAAAIGAELPIHEPNGHLIVDLGAGSTEITVLSLSSIVASTVVPGGGDGQDQSIIESVRRHHAVEIGRPTANTLKHALGSARLGGVSGSRLTKGRCLRLGIPRAVDIDAQNVQTALGPGLALVARGIRETVEQLPPELASDIVGNGVVLLGGGANLDSVQAALRHLTGLPVLVAEDPALAVVRGAARVLEEVDLLQEVAC